jgi:hypothetical protein
MDNVIIASTSFSLISVEGELIGDRFVYTDHLRILKRYVYQQAQAAARMGKI